jgi:phage shock protein C
MEKRLTRSDKERLLGGVCGGLAEYFGFDPTLVRIAFVLLAIAYGTGILLYITLWIIMPRHQAEGTGVVGDNLDDIRKRLVELEGEVKSAVTGVKAEEWKRSSGFWLGLVLVALGILFLFSTLGLLRWWRWAVIWPVALIMVGLLLVWRRR